MQAEDALKERLKELTCLYTISRDMQESLPFDVLCQRAVENLRQAMQFPEITVSVIELNGKRFTSGNYSDELLHGLHAEIKTAGEIQGHLRVYYAEEKACMIPQEHNLINAVAEMIGTQLESQQAELERERLLENLRNLTQRLVTAQAQERKQISQELHDEIGQALAGMSFNLAAIENELHPEEATSIEQHLADTNRLIVQTLQRTRDLTLRLHPIMLDDFGLVPTLRWYTDQYAKRTNIEIQFEAYDFEARLPAEIEMMFYWAVVEALTNITRHAQARRIILTLDRSETGVRALIEDDGVGFDMEALGELAPHERGFGLIGMQERVSILGGSLAIKSSKKRGTQIIIKIPWEGAAWPASG